MSRVSDSFGRVGRTGCAYPRKTTLSPSQRACGILPVELDYRGLKHKIWCPCFMVDFAWLGGALD